MDRIIGGLIDNRITGWAAFGILMGFVLFLIITDRLQWHKRAKELSNLWEQSSKKWEYATQTRDTQLTMALEQLKVVAAFFSEVDVRKIEDIDTADPKRKGS